MMLYGVASLFISSVLISHFGALRGIYVLSANLTVLVPWLSLMALGSSGRANEFQRRVVLFLGGIFTVSLLILGLSFGAWDTVLNITEVFGLFMTFPAIVLVFKWKLSRIGKKLQYPPRTVRGLWFFQWIADISIAQRASNPVWVFVFLLPALLGGYLIYKAFENSLECLGWEKNQVTFTENSKRDRQ